MSMEEPVNDLEDLLQYLKHSRSCDFTGYKRTTLTRRIQKRMEKLGVPDYSSYRDYLEADPP